MDLWAEIPEKAIKTLDLPIFNWLKMLGFNNNLIINT
jgi:hypothetical protein